MHYKKLFQLSALVLFFSLLPTLIISQFLRHSLGVTGLLIGEEIALSASQLGLLAGAFFLSLAIVQIPIGAAIDFFGPKKTMLVSILVAGSACVMFATAQSFYVLLLARILMGLGCASFLVAPLVIFNTWFVPQLFSSLTGLLMGLSVIGTLLATAPLAYAAESWGWRSPFLAALILFTLCFLMISLILKDSPENSIANTTPIEIGKFFQSFIELKQIFKVEGVWGVLILMSVATATFSTLLGLWADPYLADVHEFEVNQRSQILLGMAIGHIIGLSFWGSIDRLSSNIRLTTCIPVLSTMFFLALLAADLLTGVSLIVVLLLFGFTSAYLPLLMGQGKRLFKSEHVGRGITLLNTGTMGGVFVMQYVTGFVLQYFSTDSDSKLVNLPAEAYQHMFILMLVMIGSSLMSYMKTSKNAASAH